MRPTGAGASGPPRRRQVLDAVPPASGGVVMGSGILCVDLYSVGQRVEAVIVLWFAAGTWLLLAAVLALRVRYEPGRFGLEARALLLTRVLSHWETTLAARNGAAWLLIAASAALILGLAFYIVTVTRFALRQLLAYLDARILRRCRAGLVVPGHALAGTADRGRGAAAQTELRRTALGHGLSAWHVRGLQLRRRPGHRNHRDRRLRPGMDLASGHGEPVRARRSHPSQLARAAPET